MGYLQAKSSRDKRIPSYNNIVPLDKVSLTAVLEIFLLVLVLVEVAVLHCHHKDQYTSE